ncbi:MAG: alpha/beta hydrolase [Proteobacteria bacterium]|nr:alpha/beta hydrolase [Pseudomonadota bacterium]
MRIGKPLVAVIGVVVLAATLATLLSPWPSVLVLRTGFNFGGVRANSALASRVPAGIGERLDQVYDPASPDGRLDVFYPDHAGVAPQARLTVVWVHGGGFVSGSKGQVANYLRILAAGGFTVVGVDYTPAPELRYPGQLRQLATALGYVLRNASRLHVDPRRLVLAGDSAGAQLAAQLALLVSSPSYATRVGVIPELAPAQLAGVLLYCGPYAMNSMPDTWFSRTVRWAYSGQRHPAHDALASTLDLAAALTPAFPPVFMAVGNADPLAPQSRAFAAALGEHGVRVERLFYSPEYRPPLAHEYQSDLALAEAQEALHRSEDFLHSLE